MKCICCERGIKVIHHGDDAHGVRSSIEGAHLLVEFAYGSQVHDCDDHDDGSVQHQAAICDSCVKEKVGLIRTVYFVQARTFLETENHQIGDK